MTKEDQIKLETELQKSAYAGKSDGECALILAKASAATGSKKSSVRDIQKYMITRGIWAALKAAAPTNITADGVLDIMGSNNFTDIDLLDPASKGMIAAMVNDGILNATQKTELQDMSRITLTNAEALIGQGKKIHHLDVARARGRGI